MNNHPAIAQLRRIPVIAVVTLALLLGALVLLEQTGSAAGSADREGVEFVNLHHKATHDNGGGNGGGSNGNHEKHCNDGKGADDTKNKHCRNLSP